MACWNVGPWPGAPPLPVPRGVAPVDTVGEGAAAAAVPTARARAWKGVAAGAARVTRRPGGNPPVPAARLRAPERRSGPQMQRARRKRVAMRPGEGLGSLTGDTLATRVIKAELPRSACVQSLTYGGPDPADGDDRHRRRPRRCYRGWSDSRGAVRAVDDIHWNSGRAAGAAVQWQAAEQQTGAAGCGRRAERRLAGPDTKSCCCCAARRCIWPTKRHGAPA
jgi:hypothetical protein